MTENFVDRALLALVAVLPGRAAAALAIAAYGGLGLALPLGLGWPAVGIIAANVIGTSLAATIGLGWLALRLQEAHRRHLIEWTTSLRLLTAEEFEWLVGEIFRREGWKVRETGRRDGPDGNVDLDLTRNGQRAIVQCKRWVSWPVGVDEIRKFGGTLMRENLPGRAGIFVTLSDFQEQARIEAKKMGLSLVDHRDLFVRVENVRRAEPCADCQRPMVLGRSARGWWLRCVGPGCNGKRDLGSDPGRAVDLLTDVR